jgi:hypothetical protein
MEPKSSRCPAGPKSPLPQGQSLPIIGAVKLLLRLEGSPTEVAVEFCVVQKLVVPLLLGTPWIDRHALSINPKERVVKVQLDLASLPFETTLRPTPVKDGAVVRVAVSRAIPAFDEHYGVKLPELTTFMKNTVEMWHLRCGISAFWPERQNVASLMPHFGVFLRKIADAGFGPIWHSEECQVGHLGMPKSAFHRTPHLASQMPNLIFQDASREWRTRRSGNAIFWHSRVAYGTWRNDARERQIFGFGY